MVYRGETAYCRVGRLETLEPWQALLEEPVARKTATAERRALNPDQDPRAPVPDGGIMMAELWDLKTGHHQVDWLCPDYWAVVVQDGESGPAKCADHERGWWRAPRTGLRPKKSHLRLEKR